MLPSLAKETIIIERPVMVTDRGSQVPDWTQPPAETITVAGCSVQPFHLRNADDRAHRDGVKAVFTIWAPPGTTVGPVDHVLVDSYPTPLILDAEPLRWAVQSVLDHVVLQLNAWNTWEETTP